MGALGEPERWDGVFDAAERSVLELADALTADSANLEPVLVARVREHWSEAQRAEILLVIGEANFNNRAGNGAKQLLGG